MRENIIVAFLFLQLSLLHSQPGGGGGLRILHFLDQNFKPIDLIQSTVQIRSFVLSNGKVDHETYFHDDLKTAHKNISGSNQLQLQLSPRNYYDLEGTPHDPTDHRLFIVYKNDTMLIDFTDVLGENGGGVVDEMDSLVFMKGHFILKRTFYRDFISGDEQIDYYKMLKRGLTPSFLNHLRTEQLLEIATITNYNWLKEENMPASHHYHAARRAYFHKDYQLALAEVDKGSKKSTGKSCAALLLYTDIYAALKEYEKATNKLSQAMNCKRFVWQDEATVDNLRQRAELLTLAGNYDKALSDYNEIVRVGKDTLENINQRALFKIRYLNDAAGAINELKKIISSIPSTHLLDRPGGLSEYDDSYFNLAFAYYQQGKHSEAFRYWLKAAEIGGGQTYSETAIQHFDSIIQKHPEVKENYLSRAIVLYRQAINVSWDDHAKNILKTALQDLEVAEKKGFDNFRIHLYRAMILKMLNKHKEAFESIKKSIKKNENYALSYMIRYHLRVELGKAKWGDESDKDMKKYEKLRKETQFQRW